MLLLHKLIVVSQTPMIFFSDINTLEIQCFYIGDTGQLILAAQAE